MIDAHAHLTDARLAADLDRMLERAAAAGVQRILTCGEDVASSERAVAVARRHPMVRAAVGIHPHRAADCDGRAIARIRELTADPRVVGVGEIGIDLSGRSAPRTDQERAFASQVELAAELDLPVSLHVRDAGGLVRALLERLPRVRGHVHCYSEGPAEVDEWIGRGLAISFAGTVTYPTSERLRSAVALVPADGLLLETDSPYLAPQRHRGHVNEPAFIAATYEHVARIRGVAARDLVDRVGENAARLFGGRW